jgi:hypothetical protein
MGKRKNTAGNNTQHMSKNPWIAGLLNFIFMGAGYLYAGKRRVFGAGLVFTFLVVTYETLARPTNHLGDPLGTHLVSMFVLAFVLAYDGYTTVVD